MSITLSSAILALAVQAAVLPGSRVSRHPPNGVLEVAYRQLLQGDLSESIHQLTLECWDGR